jgi:uncharacterized HAD superfamily protein
MHSFRHALLVDDSLHTGSSMADALQKVSVSNPNCRITTLAVYVAPQAIEKVDIFLEKCPMPRIFEWNLMHNSHLSQSCVDIDGILCRDPEEPENDDGMKYLQFLESADPYLLPTLPIGYLVTCRLEKYRKQTEAWLRRYNIKYNELIMMDLPSKEARVKAGSHGKFKAEAYERTGAILFIESSLRQAVEIANRTCKPVICIETRSLIPPDLMSVNKRLARKLPTWLSSRRKSFINRVKTKLIARAID